MRIDRVPVISTSHLPSETAIAEAPLYAAAYEHGWLLAVHQIEDPIPDWYITLYLWAKRHGFEWVRFDCDADTVEDLPTWEW